MKKNCQVKSNCIFCTYHQHEQVKGITVHSQKAVCLEGKDLDRIGNPIEDFDYGSEKDCCDYDFWKVLEGDEDMKQLFDNDMAKAEKSPQDEWVSYKYFAQKY